MVTPVILVVSTILAFLEIKYLTPWHKVGVAGIENRVVMSIV